jgi:hypothetical protein
VRLIDVPSRLAATPGAFLDLATDLSWLAGDGLGPGAFVLDQDLAVPGDPAAPSGLKACR